jgi:hypothetical protein
MVARRLFANPCFIVAYDNQLDAAEEAASRELQEAVLYHTPVNSLSLA